MENNWKNNPKISVNILYFKEKEICPAYISKINSKWLILKTTNSINDSNEEKEGWHNPAVKIYYSHDKQIKQVNSCFDCQTFYHNL